MHFDDLDIVGLAQPTRSELDQFEQHVHTDAHVWREHDGYGMRAFSERVLLGVGETGRADHRGNVGAGAGSHMRQRAFRPCEIDVHIGIAQGGRNIGGNCHTGRAPEALTRIATEQWAAYNFQRPDKLKSGICQRRLDERPAHPSAAAGDAESYCHQPSFSMSWRNQFFSPVFGAVDSDLSSAASPPPERATSAGGGGISSPSQRASLSSAKYAVNRRCSSVRPCRLNS